MMMTTMLVAMVGAALAEAPPPVVGGRPVDAGDWPDVAMVWFGDEPGCTGTLVAPDLVLTAGHCARGATHVSLDHTRSRDAEKREIAEIHTHNRWGRTLDLAAFRLAEPVEGVRPRRLARRGLRDDARVTIVGWGATDRQARNPSRLLMEGDASIWDHDCSQRGWGCNQREAEGQELVAGADDVDSCNGDSGGPLYLGRGDRALLVGITSRAVNGYGPPCGDGGIYVRADAAAVWLDSLAHSPPEPEEEGDADGYVDRPPGPVGACSSAPLGVALVPALLALGLVARRRQA
jgi:secreted trypsin-like serine protease